VGRGSPAERFAEADAIVAAGVAQGRFPGGVLAVGRAAGADHVRAFGRLAYAEGSPGVEAASRYDLASLTKVMATTAVLMALSDEGSVDLATPLQGLLPAFKGGDKARVTLWHLLAHASGLPAWAPLFRDASGRDAVVASASALPLEAGPGERSLYSDVGFILLGAALEAQTGRALEALVEERVLRPLGMGHTGFNPGAELRAATAPTEIDAWRGRLLQGEAHDENAFAMGGVAGHSGLFGPVGDVIRFARTLLGGGELEGRRLASAATVERFTRRCDVPGSSRALGWNTPSPGSSAGRLLSARSFGHTGFAGTSLWIDPERGVFVALLTNRVHPSRQGPGIQEIRAGVADAVVRGLEAS
jgi:CubicO group peptidase (beta-lactamase class C family)